MAYIRVKLVANNKTYSVEVDEDADPIALAQSFAKETGLPEGKGYRLYLVDALKVHSGATLRLVEKGTEGMYRGLKEISE